VEGTEQQLHGLCWKGRRYKRLEIAVDIAKELNLRLLIVGKGPYRGKLVRYASKVYRGGVEFLEPQPRQKYLELLPRARYAVNSSKHEAFSIFTAEALACGVPVITTAIAEFKIWYKQGVYLCNNFEELEKLLSLIIKSEEEVRRALIGYSHQFRQLFSWDNLADKFINE
jgi:glycosyltransferase involved in cell wall biosynthesis